MSNITSRSTLLVMQELQGGNMKSAHSAGFFTKYGDRKKAQIFLFILKEK